MPNFPLVLADLNRKRRTFNKNFTSFRGENLDQVIRELQKSCQEIQEALVELQESQVASKDLAIDGLPNHGSACESFNGQFLRLTQTVAGPTIVIVQHGLKRVPQGIVWIHSTAHNRVMISGDKATNTPPATKSTVSIRLNGAANDEHIGILF